MVQLISFFSELNFAMQWLHSYLFVKELIVIVLLDLPVYLTSNKEIQNFVQICYFLLSEISLYRPVFFFSLPPFTYIGFL